MYLIKKKGIKFKNLNHSHLPTLGHEESIKTNIDKPHDCIQVSFDETLMILISDFPIYMKPKKEFISSIMVLLLTEAFSEMLEKKKKNSL